MGLVTLKKAIQLLKSGTPVALPTETVYGLAAPINQPDALKKIFKIKKRPLSDPLIVHACDLRMALKLLKNPSPVFKKLAHTFWPGPLTLVCKKNNYFVSDLITSGLESVAVRIPQSDLFQKVIKEVGSCLAAPSANIFKKTSPTSAQHVLKTLPQVDVLDGGRCDIGIESAILDVDTLTILRPGQITNTDIEKALGLKISYKEQSHMPGSESNHYQPDTPVYVFSSQKSLNKFSKENDSIQLFLNKSAKKSSHNFYDDLRQCDGKAKYIIIYFNPNWVDKSWIGLKNRIQKASSKWTRL